MGCDWESDLEEEISKIPMDIEIERFDKLLSKANEESLRSIKADYPFMFREKALDSSLLNQINDEFEQMLFAEVSKTFTNDTELEREIEDLFRHIRYYNKNFIEPRVITRTSFVDYHNKVAVTDSLVLIALDTYLGESHKFYVDIYKYFSQNMRPTMIISDMAGAYAEYYIPTNRRRTFLDEMIYYGKVLYFKDLVIPWENDADKIGYSQEQFDWAEINESNIWSYFIEQELLFDTDNQLLPRFINPGPFSKFNLVLDNESPGRLGQYIGWQIVRAYVKNNDVTLQDLLVKDAETIFNKSKFKPRK
jgi:gliding motility-associated lipoprotein GldB